jgi:hypothetical protein
MLGALGLGSRLKNAAQILFNAAGTGAVTRPLQDKERDIVSVFDFFGTAGVVDTAAIADVRARTGAVDVTSYLNTAYAYGANNSVAIFEPAGVYKSTDTLWVTPAGSTFKSAHIMGAGGGFSESDAQVIHDARTVTTKPAFNMQLGRGVYLGHFAIRGPNVAPRALTSAQQIYSAAWVTGGVRDSQYSPQCGICIDGGVGSTPPDGGYPGFTYRGLTSGTGNVSIDHVTILDCVVSVMGNPELTATQGNNVLINYPFFNGAKVSIAQGNAQSRAWSVIGGALGNCRTVFDGLEYGTKQGSCPMFFHTEMGPAFELLSIQSGVTNGAFIGVRSESVHRIGYATAGTSAYPITFVNTAIHLLTPALGKRCPVVAEFGDVGFIWKGGALVSDSGNDDAFTILANPATLEGLNIGVNNRFKPFIGCGPSFNNPLNLRNCRVHDASAAIVHGVEETRRGLSLSGRITEHWSATFRRAGKRTYHYIPGNQDNFVNIATASNFVFTDTTLTFDNTNAADLQVGDILNWRFNAIGKSAVQQTIPGLKITSIAAPTVTCSLLYARSYYDETFAPTSISVLTHEWAPGQTLTGDITNASPTINNVSPTTILQNGDWIVTEAAAGVGIQAPSRVVSGAGTATITLSRNAIRTVTGIGLNYGRVRAVPLLNGVGKDVGDRALSLTPNDNERTQIWNTPLTANRAVTLVTAGAEDGDTFEIVRTAAATGAFTLDVGTGPLKSLAAGQWCVVKFSALTGAWYLDKFGSL